MEAIYRKRGVLSNESLPYEAIARLDGHDGPVSTVIFSKDGKYCLTGSFDRTIFLWNPLRLDPAHPPAKHIPSTNGKILLDDLPRSLPIQTYRDGITHPISAVAIDDNSSTVVSGSERTLVVNDLVTGQCKRRLQGHLGRINGVSISQDAQVYLSASYDATVRLWDGRSRGFEPIQIFKEAKDSVTAVHTVQSQDLSIVRTASVDGVVRVYDLRMGIVTSNNVESPITGMCPTSDQRCLLINCLDGAMRLIDLEKGRILKHYAEGHKAGHYGLNCSLSSGDDLAVTGSEDGSAALYDISKGRICQVLTGQRQPTCAVAMHPCKDQASVCITASFDGSAVVWGNDAGLMQW